MPFITKSAEDRQLTIDDAIAAAEILRELDAGHEHAAYAVAAAYGLDGMVAEMLEHLCATFDIEV